MSDLLRLVSRITLPAAPTAMAIRPQGGVAVVAGEGWLATYRLNGGQEVSRWNVDHPITDIAVCAEQNFVATTTGTASINIYDLESGELIRDIKREAAPGSFADEPATHLGLTPDGKTVIATTAGSRICLSNVETGLWEHILFVKYNGCDVAVSPDGSHVVLFGQPKPSEISGHLTMFRVRRGLELLWTKWHESDQAVTSAVFSPDRQRLVTCGAGDGARVWKVETGELVAHASPKADSALQSAWIVGNSEHIAMFGEKIRIVRVQEDRLVDEKPMGSTKMIAVDEQGITFLTMLEASELEVWNIDLK